MQAKQLKPVFCISNTTVKKAGRVDHEISRQLNSKIAPGETAIKRLKSKLSFETDVETGYTSPGEIKYLFGKVKLAEGVRLVDGGTVKKENKADGTSYGDTAFRITKTDYNKM